MDEERIVQIATKPSECAAQGGERTKSGVKWYCDILNDGRLCDPDSEFFPDYCPLETVHEFLRKRGYS